MNDAGEKPHSLGLELVRSDDTRQAQQLAVDRDDVFGDVETFSYIPHDRWKVLTVTVRITVTITVVVTAGEENIINQLLCHTIAYVKLLLE